MLATPSSDVTCNMIRVLETLERRVVVALEGSASALCVIQELSRWNDAKEIYFDAQSELASLLQALQRIQLRVEKQQNVPLKWKIGADDDEEIPF